MSPPRYDDIERPAGALLIAGGESLRCGPVTSPKDYDPISAETGEPDAWIADLSLGAAHRFGAWILKAKDGDSLDERVEEVLYLPGWARFSGLIGAILHQGLRVGHRRSQRSSDRMIQIFGEHGARRIGATLKLHAQTLEQSLRMFRDGGQLPGVSGRALENAPGPTSFLGEENIPIEIQRLLLSVAASGPASMAVIYALRPRGRPLRPEIADRITLRWLEGQRAWYTLLAATQGVKLPPVRGVPALDVEKILADHTAYKLRLDQSLEAARSRGFPPPMLTD